MIWVICTYIGAVVMIHLLLFTRAQYMSKILLINSGKDTNFIDVIFFYIIMSPIGFYGIFLYYKNIARRNITNKIVEEKQAEKEPIENKNADTK